MQLEAFLWLFLPVFVAGGSALLSYCVMQARMEVALAKERETLAEARAAINTHKVTLDERVRAIEEATKRQALDDFMHDIRTEERSYVRESTNSKTMVMQERLYFRNIPLSNWIDHEMLIEDGATGKLQGQIAKESVFVTKPLAAAPPPPHHEDTALALSHLLQEVQKAQIVPLPEREPQAQVLLTHHATAFGAQ
jgi:hypothetical protein